MRIFLLGSNFLLLCCSLITFEVRSFMSDKLGYFKSFWNLNDVTLFLMSMVVLTQELKAYSQNKNLYGLPVIDEKDDNDDLLLRMLKKKKKKRGSGLDLDPAEYYNYDSWLEWLRVSYCILIMNVSVKVLNVAQFNDSIAFLVKILEEVVSVILPFLVLWLSIMWMFFNINIALDVVYYNADSPFITGDYEGFFGMFGATVLFTIRMSVGDF